jgi:hypothetical protein
MVAVSSIVVLVLVLVVVLTVTLTPGCTTTGDGFHVEANEVSVRYARLWEAERDRYKPGPEWDRAWKEWRVEYAKELREVYSRYNRKEPEWIGRVLTVK